MRPAAIGVDVGGTAIKAVAVDDTGRVLREHTVPTHQDRTRLLAAVRDVVATLAEETGSADPIPDPRSPIPDLGIATAGLPDRDSRRTEYCPGTKLDIEGVHWAEALAWARPVPVVNDAHAALLGECWTGAGRGHAHVVLLTLGTGVGGAVLADGRLLRGARGRAGHLGHLSVSENPTRGIVGTPGTLEDAIGEQTVTHRTGGRAASTQALVAAARQGEAWAVAAWAQSVATLSRAVASIINAFDPEVLIIGGGIAQAGAALFEPLARHLDEDEWKIGGRGVQILPAQLGARAGAIGAARLALAGADAAPR